MIFFRSPEFRRRFDLSHDRTIEPSALFNFRLRFVSSQFLRRRMIKNYRAILGSSIRALTIQRGRVVIRPKHVEQLIVTDLRRIEFDFDHFSVAGSVRADILVGWVFFCSPGVTNRSRQNAFQISKRFFDTPKAAGPKCRFVCAHVGRWNKCASFAISPTWDLPSAASQNNLFSSMPDSSTIQNTRSPRPARFFNRCDALFGKLGLRWGNWSAQHLIELAVRRTGLEDFGGGEFFEPLSRLLESCDRDAKLNAIGKLALRSDLVRTLCNRLWIERDRQREPRIGQRKICEPLFIIGLPRSGTTLLHMLLAADPDHRAPLSWEVMFPSPPNDENKPERIRRTAKNLSALRWLAPTFERVHATGATMPQECVSLMSPSFLSDQFDTMYNVPSYRVWFLKQDLQPAYEFHRRFLQQLQQRKSAQRWVLKAPAHLFALPALLSIYPDARFVQAHREPIETIASVSSLITILRRVFSDRVDANEIAREAWRYWSETMTRFMRERDRVLAPERIFDLQYSDIRRDPIDAVEQIYEYFGWPLGSGAKAKIEEALAKQPPEQNGFHHYRASQFGLEEMDREKDFGAYCERFGLSSRATSETAELIAG